MDDPLQLAAMQELGSSDGIMPELLGLRAPMSQGGADWLTHEANARMLQRPTTGMALPNVSALASLNLGQYGGLGSAVDLLGSPLVSSFLQSNGRLAVGNATNVEQALRARRFLQEQTQVSKSVGMLDAQSHYQTYRGIAAIAGMPFNAEQRRAARSLAGTTAAATASLAMFAPELADSLAGERGSAAAMANQMMQFNRYAVDPVTGRMGYSAEANTRLVETMFNNMFAAENMPNMRGIRAGDIGSLYSELGSRGMLGGRDSLRDRTLASLQAARAGGTDLAALSKEAGLGRDLPAGLSGLSDMELEKLRGTSTVQSSMTKIDATSISGKLQSYTSALSALREVFGENGNQNAPIPLLVASLEALTSGQMQKFDPSRLNNMIRDMQSLSQTTGKSMDQLAFMNQSAAAQGQSLGIGSTFSPEAMRTGVLTGQALQDTGMSTGFGAISKSEAEMEAMSRFNQGLTSEFGNVVGAMTRIEKAGDFADNAAGRRMKSIMQAIDAHSTTYVDPETGQTFNVPTRPQAFTEMITQGAVKGMGLAEFNTMLSQQTSNLRAMHGNTTRQGAAFRAQGAEAEMAMTLSARDSISTSLYDTVADPKQRRQVSDVIGVAASKALFELGNTATREDQQRAVADAIMKSSSDSGVTLSESEAAVMAEAALGSMETRANNMGFQSLESFRSIHGRDVSERRRTIAMQVDSRSRLNQANAPLNNSDITRNVIKALQKAGGDPAKANLTNLFADILGAPEIEDIEKNMLPMVKAAEDKRLQIEAKIAAIGETKDPVLQARLQREADALSAELQNDISGDIVTKMKELGIGGDGMVFDREDAARVARSGRQLRHNANYRAAVQLGESAAVSAADLTAVRGSKLTDDDLFAIAEMQRMQDSRTAKGLSVDQMDTDTRKRYDELVTGGLSQEAALQKTRQERQSEIESYDYASAVHDTFKDASGSDISDEETLRAVAVGRRLRVRDVTAEDIDARTTAMGDGIADAAVRRRTAEDMLHVERQLKVAGMLSSDGTLLDDLSKANPELAAVLVDTPLQDRPAVATSYLRSKAADSLSVENFDDTQSQVRRFQRSAEGQQLDESSREAYEDLTNLREDYLSDKVASRAGGVAGLQAVQKSREADFALREAAERYAGGNMAAYLQDGVAAADAKGNEAMAADFAAMTPQQKQEMLARLKMTHPVKFDGKSVSDLDIGSFRMDLDAQRQSHMQTMSSAREAMLPGEGGGLQSLVTGDIKGLQLSDKARGQLRQARVDFAGYTESELSALDTVGGIRDKVKAAGVSDAEYERYLKSGTTGDAKQDAVLSKEDAETYQAAQKDLRPDVSLDTQLLSRSRLEKEFDAVVGIEADKEILSAADVFMSASGLAGEEDTTALRGIAAEKGTKTADNMQMFSDVLSGLKHKQYTAEQEQKLFGGVGKSSLEKLDSITDRWTAAKGADDRRAIASEFGYSEDELNKMMRRTSALHLETLDAGKGELTGKQLASRMAGLSGQDIAAEVKSEEDRTMRLEGTIEVVGVVNGQATTRNLTAVSAR